MMPPCGLIVKLYLALSACSIEPQIQQVQQIQQMPPSHDSRLKTIDILVVRYHADVAREILIEAEQQASRIFLAAGVRLRWTEDVFRAPRFSVVIFTKPPQDAGPESVSPDAMAFTTTVPPEVGGRAVVYYERLRELTRTAHWRPSLLLGTVIAHEIGHMLLPATGHSMTGLMRRHLDATDLGLVEKGRLRLTKDQVQQIHRALSQTLARGSASAGRSTETTR